MSVMSDKAAAEPCDTVADFPVFGHVWTDFFNCSGIVTACQSICNRFAVEMLVVRGIEGYSRCLDKDIARFDVGWDGKRRGDFNNALGLGHNCLLGSLRWNAHNMGNVMTIERKDRENIRFLSPENLGGFIDYCTSMYSKLSLKAPQSLFVSDIGPRPSPYIIPMKSSSTN